MTPKFSSLHLTQSNKAPFGLSLHGKCIVKPNLYRLQVTKPMRKVEDIVHLNRQDKKGFTGINNITEMAHRNHTSLSLN